MADEVHFIKNHTSKRCKAALPLLQQAKRAVLLSGTPALSRPAELITLLQAALPAAKVTAKAFAARYCQVRSVLVVTHASWAWVITVGRQGVHTSPVWLSLAPSVDQPTPDLTAAARP